MEDYRTIPLSQGKEALVDAADYELISQFKWYAHKQGNTFYAVRTAKVNGKWGSIKMHVLIMGELPSPGMEVDHKNLNGLDNRRINLRWSTKAQNISNARKKKGTSQFKGACWDKRERKWKSQITINRKHVNLGRFSNEEDAARAYDAAAKRFFGEFARLNFPEETVNGSSVCTS